MSPWTRGIAWLHCFSCLCRLRTDRCISHRGKSQTYYPEHILGYERLEYLLLSCRGFQIFLDRLLVFFLCGEGPCTALSRDSGAGAWSPSLDGDLGPQDRTVMGWSYLCLGYKQGMCFRGTQLGALIRESSGDPVWLDYGLASL